MSTLQSTGFENPIYIDSDQLLAQYCSQWSHCTLLALDTEFIRTDTFFPKGALLQVSDGSGCFLIDPLTIQDFSAFTKLMADPSVVKVLHSCSEDLEVFDCLFGVIPSPLIDTQIAAALDGLGFSLGYQRMTEQLLGIHVPKGETRSNWLQRPLSGSQIHYAALDVAYLLEMYQLLVASLDKKGRLEWLQEECQSLLDNYNEKDKISAYYKRIKSAWRLSAQQLTLLQRLAIWREHEARRRDVPRSRVIKDSVCLEIANRQPTSVNGLFAIADFPYKAVQKYAEALLALVKEAQSYPEAHLLPRLPKPLPTEVNGVLKSLKAHIRSRADQLQLAPELLAKKRDYEALLRSGCYGGDYQLPASLSGWRKAVVGDELLALVKS